MEGEGCGLRGRAGCPVGCQAAEDRQPGPVDRLCVQQQQHITAQHSPRSSAQHTEACPPTRPHLGGPAVGALHGLAILPADLLGVLWVGQHHLHVPPPRHNVQHSAAHDRGLEGQQGARGDLQRSRQGWAGRGGRITGWVGALVQWWGGRGSGSPAHHSSSKQHPWHPLTWEQKPMARCEGQPGSAWHLCRAVWVGGWSAGMTPNSTAVLPLTRSCQRSTPCCAVDMSETSSLGPMPVRRTECSAVPSARGVGEGGEACGIVRGSLRLKKGVDMAE